MKIAIVHDYLHKIGGAEALANAIFEVFPTADIYTATYDKKLIDSLEFFRGAKIYSPRWGNLFSKKIFIPFLPFYFERLDLSKYDLIISSTAHFAKGVKTNKKQIHISYIHTPPRFLYGYEGSTRNRDAWYMKILLWPTDFYLRHKDQQFAQRPNFLLCNSKEVQARIMRIYKRDATVIYPFAQIGVAPEKKGLPLFQYDNPPYLIVSRLESYKNIDLAVNVCGKNNIPLKIAGDGSEMENLKKLASKFKTVKMLGLVSEEMKATLYQACKAFLGTVKDEDFGMSLLEPMMYGKPVVALRSGGYLETVIENKTGVFFDKLTEESLIEGLKKIDSITWDSNYIKKHAQKFTKEKFQKNIKNFVKEKLNLLHNS